MHASCLHVCTYVCVCVRVCLCVYVNRYVNQSHIGKRMLLCSAFNNLHILYSYRVIHGESVQPCTTQAHTLQHKTPGIQTPALYYTYMDINSFTLTGPILSRLHFCCPGQCCLLPTSCLWGWEVQQTRAFSSQCLVEQEGHVLHSSSVLHQWCTPCTQWLTQSHLQQ